jgi:hypothetical protein
MESEGEYSKEEEKKKKKRKRKEKKVAKYLNFRLERDEKVTIIGQLKYPTEFGLGQLVNLKQLKPRWLFFFQDKIERKDHFPNICSTAAFHFPIDGMAIIFEIQKDAIYQS